MCLTQDDKERLVEKLNGGNAYTDELTDEDWQLLMSAVDDCDWEGDIYYDSQCVVTITCSKCGASFSGCGGAGEDYIDAYLR